MPADHDGSATPLVYAVIPAAGRSQRMKAPKQLLPFGDSTVLECVIETVLAAPTSGLAVVTHAAVAAELDLAEDPRFITVINDDAESQMLDSIRMGVGALHEAFEPGGDSGILVCPGDMPAVGVEDAVACIIAFVERRDTIIVASHQGKRGHPIIIPQSMVPELETIHEGGLAELLTRFPDKVQAVECSTPAVTRDLDTPQDYDELSRPR